MICQEGRRVSSEVRLGNCTQVWGVGQIWRAWDSRLRKNSTSHLAWLVQTCPDAQYSDHVRSSRTVFFCTFERSYSSVLCPILVKLHILTRLIDSFPMVHGSWSCIEIEMLIPLGGPCLRAIDRKSFERGNFLVPCWKLHISTQVIDSFPLPYSPKSCDKEKLSIPLEPHQNAHSSEIFPSFPPKKLKEL